MKKSYGRKSHMFYQSYQNILWADAVQKYCEVSKSIGRVLKKSSARNLFVQFWSKLW